MVSGTCKRISGCTGTSFPESDRSGDNEGGLRLELGTVVVGKSDQKMNSGGSSFFFLR